MKIDLVRAIDRAGDALGERVVEIVAAEQRIAARSERREPHALLHDRGGVERAAAEVEHEQAAGTESACMPTASAPAIGSATSSSISSCAILAARTIASR